MPPNRYLIGQSFLCCSRAQKSFNFTRAVWFLVTPWWPPGSTSLTDCYHHTTSWSYQLTCVHLTGSEIPNRCNLLCDSSWAVAQPLPATFFSTSVKDRHWSQLGPRVKKLWPLHNLILKCKSKNNIPVEENILVYKILWWICAHILTQYVISSQSLEFKIHLFCPRKAPSKTSSIKI